MLFDLTEKLVWVAGQHGMVGRAIVRRLRRDPCRLLLDPGRALVDFRRQSEVEDWMALHCPQIVFLTAGRVGGIYANDAFPVDFLYDNLLIEANIIHAAYRIGVEKLLFFGSSCIYPRLAPQPIPEDALLTGPLEPTNEAYAVAKIAGIKLCQSYHQQYGCDFISAMPTNLYGPQDNFNLTSSHVLPALIRKFHDAKVNGQRDVTIWGSGSPRREFLHVDDLADACLFLMDRYNEAEHVNVGVGEDLSIRELAEMVRDVVHPSAELVFDRTKPDGTPRKLLNMDRLHALGWRHKIALRDGIASTYDWFVEHEVPALSAVQA